MTEIRVWRNSSKQVSKLDLVSDEDLEHFAAWPSLAEVLEKVQESCLQRRQVRERHSYQSRRCLSSTWAWNS